MRKHMLVGVFTAAAALSCGNHPADGNDPAALREATDGGTDADDCPVSCSLGCRPGSDVCYRLTPSLLAADTCDTPGSKDLVLTTVTTLDTGTNCDAVVVQGAPAPDICVLKYAVVNITSELRVIGPRALAIVATESMSIDGLLDAGGHQKVSGPGGSDARGSGNAGAGSGGGSGAGHATAGADTWRFDPPPPSLSGGASYGPSILPLLPGARGGATTPFAEGGAGGGALQLVSCSAMTIRGKLTVGGGGGLGGYAESMPERIARGGAGGGSGGSVLLEAPSVAIAGGVFSNGGAGGGGGRFVLSGPDAYPGGYGEDGSLSASQAARGGGGGAPGAGRGGNGAIQAASPSGGDPPATTMGAGGGGGGAMGLIHINVRSGTTPDIGGAALSPVPSQGSVNVH